MKKSNWREFVSWQTTEGPTLDAGAGKVIPESQALSIRFPGGGMVWNRPTAVTFVDGNQTTRIPIHDITRLIQIAALGLGGLALFAGVLVSRRGRF